jgi:hypothetical protein
MRTGLQVSADGGLILVAETFIDVLVHERRLADAVEILDFRGAEHEQRIRLTRYHLEL